MKFKPLSRRGFLKTVSPLLSLPPFWGIIKQRSEVQSGPTQGANLLTNAVNETSPLRQLSAQQINARNYGFLPGATPARNSSALQAAWRAARNARLDVFIPAGSYLISPIPDAMLQADWDVEVLGAGKHRTYIRCDPAVTLNTNFEFMIVAPGKKLTVEGITLEGPGSISGDLDGRNAPVCTGIHHQGNLGGVTLRNVAMSRWGNAVLMEPSKKNPGDNDSFGGELRAYSSDFRGRKSSVVCHAGNTSNASIYALDCTFGLDPDCFIDQARGWHALELYSGVSFDLNDCTFVSSNKYGIRVDHGSQPNVLAKKAAVNNCNFLRQVGALFQPGMSGINTGIFAVGVRGHPLIVRGGSFHATHGISIGCDTIIEGVQFFGYGFKDANGVWHGRGSAVIDDDGGQGNVTITGCAISAGCDVLDGDNPGYNVGIRRQSAGPLYHKKWGRANAVWVIGNNTFGHAESAAIMVERGQVMIKDNVFHVGIPSFDLPEGHSPTYNIGHCIYLKGGTTIVSGNKFMERGTGGAMAIYAAPTHDERTPDEDINLTLLDNEFLVDTQLMFEQGNNNKKIFVRGRGNRGFEHTGRPGVSILPHLHAANTNTSGILRFGAGEGTLEPIGKILHVNANYDTYTHKELGAPDYDGIEVWGANPSAPPQLPASVSPGARNAVLFHGAPIRLVATTAFILNHDKNSALWSKIFLKGETDRTLAINEVIELMYDSELLAWREM